MVKQVKIFIASSSEKLQQEINNFCMDFFPEEITSIKILHVHSESQWIGYVVYQKDEYQNQDNDEN